MEELNQSIKTLSELTLGSMETLEEFEKSFNNGDQSLTTECVISIDDSDDNEIMETNGAETDESNNCDRTKLC